MQNAKLNEEFKKRKKCERIATWKDRRIRDLKKNKPMYANCHLS